MNTNGHNHLDHAADPGQPLNAGEAAPAAPTVSTLVGVVPERLLDEGEVVILAIKPSLWFIPFYSAKVGALIIAALVVFPYLPRDLASAAALRTVYQIGAALIIVQLTIAFLQWLSRLYVLTNRRVMRIRGIFNIDVFDAPLTRIQNTFITLAIHERALGLGSIQFATAGTGVVEANWVNINTPLEVHEIVRRAIRQAQRGPTNASL